MGTGATIRTGSVSKNTNRSSLNKQSSYYSPVNPYVYGVVLDIIFEPNNIHIIYTPFTDRVGTSNDKKGIAYPFYPNSTKQPNKGDIVPLVIAPDRQSLGMNFNPDKQYDKNTYYLDPIDYAGTPNANNITDPTSTEESGGDNYKNNDLGFQPSQKEKEIGNKKAVINNQGYKTAYPEFPFTDPRPPADIMPFKTAISYLKSKYGNDLGKAVFAVLFAEASKTDDKTAFRSAGGHNYAGVQTDNARWGAPGIIGQYSRVDSGNQRRSFAIFASDQTFLDFMANRIKKKGFKGNNGDEWTNTYINSWWSPAAKSSYTKGTTTYNSKLSIYNSAMTRFNSVA
jgi:hypothetical protein